jgi:hypothetical protein
MIRCQWINATTTENGFVAIGKRIDTTSCKKMTMGTTLVHYSYFAQVVTANNHEEMLFEFAQELAHQRKREGQSFN